MSIYLWGSWYGVGELGVPKLSAQESAALILVAYAVARAMYWPNVFALRVGLETAYRLVALIAAAQLIHFRWARSEIGPWILSVTLLSLHLEWAPVNAVFPPAYNLMIDLLL